MEPVSMNDGLDSRETLAFGLAAGEVAVFVLALLSAYAVLRAGLAGAVAWTLAALLAGGGALLSWGRVAGRPMVEWAVLLAAFAVRTRHAQLARLRNRVRRCSAAAGAAAGALRSRAAAAAPAPSRQAGAVVIPLALRRPERADVQAAVAAPPAASGRSHVVGFFSLAGGSGRTTLAVEVAAVLAMRARAAGATGSRGSRVALLDLARRNPTVGLRLGMPAPAGGAPTLVAHETGLLVGLAPASSLPPGIDEVAAQPAAVEALDAAEAAADIVVVDFDCDLGALCQAVLRRCDQVLVTVTPTPRGVVDAYRSTAVLRLGMRERLGHVLNRWRPGVDLDETMADLGGFIAAEIPDDDAVMEAESHHRPAGLDGDGAVAAALNRLATWVEETAGAAPSAVPRWGSHAG